MRLRGAKVITGEYANNTEKKQLLKLSLKWRSVSDANNAKRILQSAEKYNKTQNELTL